MNTEPTTGADPHGVVYIERKGNGLAVAALVLGIIGTIFGLIPLTFFIALVCGVVGLGLGVPALIQAHRGRRGGKVMAWFGVALSTIAFALSIWGALIVNDVFEDTERELDRIERELNQP